MVHVDTPEAIAARLAAFASLGLGVAHELGNALNVIVSNASTLAEDLAALRTRLPDGDAVAIELDALVAAAGDVVAATDQLVALAAALRALPR
jgi:hypothetical protein